MSAYEVAHAIEECARDPVHCAERLMPPKNSYGPTGHAISPR
ncbi:hypothetical protein ACIGXF_14185 [Streptomyces sp. NPDC053086]